MTTGRRGDALAAVRAECSWSLRCGRALRPRTGGPDSSPYPVFAPVFDQAGVAGRQWEIWSTSTRGARPAGGRPSSFGRRFSSTSRARSRTLWRSGSSARSAMPSSFPWPAHRSPRRRAAPRSSRPCAVRPSCAPASCDCRSCGPTASRPTSRARCARPPSRVKLGPARGSRSPRAGWRSAAASISMIPRRSPRPRLRPACRSTPVSRRPVTPTWTSRRCSRPPSCAPGA